MKKVFNLVFIFIVFSFFILPNIASACGGGNSNPEYINAVPESSSSIRVQYGGDYSSSFTVCWKKKGNWRQACKVNEFCDNLLGTIGSTGSTLIINNLESNQEYKIKAYYGCRDSHIGTTTATTLPGLVGNDDGIQAAVTEDSPNIENTVEDSFPNTKVKVFPNPVTTQMFKMKLPKEVERANIRIVNLQGNLVKELVANGNSIDIDTSDLSAGMYLIYTTIGEEVFSNKVVIAY